MADSELDEWFVVAVCVELIGHVTLVVVTGIIL